MALWSWEFLDPNWGGIFSRAILSGGTGANSYADARLSNPKDSPPVRRRYERADRVGKISIDPSSVRNGDMAGKGQEVGLV